MTIPLISIGKSKGIRLSKTLLEKYKIIESLELIMEKDFIILNPASTPRKGWSKAFQKMAERGEDKLLLNDVLTDEKFEKWK